MNENIINEAKTKYHGKFPPQRLPSSRKGDVWKIGCVEWADSKSFFRYTPVMSTTINMKINYDLVNGKLHMADIKAVINPEELKDKTTPTKIQHYPLINSRIDVLRGEEKRRLFDYRVVITNPNAVSEVEKNKRDAIYQELQGLMSSQSSSQEEFDQRISELEEFFTYEYQDIREVRANCLLNHYSKEYDMPTLFNAGFTDVLIVGTEIYLCDIVGGEPVIEKLNPEKVHVYKTGNSNNIEDADVVVIEDYWSPGQVVDTYHDCLTKNEIDYILNGSNDAESDDDDFIDERKGYVNAHMIDDTITYTNIDTDGEEQSFYFDPFGLFSNTTDEFLPFDMDGNVRVLRVFWKSSRIVKKVKSYNSETGEEEFNFYPESYIIKENLGEEEEIYYINQAWEGTKIGRKIYVNIRPRPVQFNRLSNPSRCHFGIVGSIYNINDSHPYSFVDRMKPYNYAYDVYHDRLNRLIAKNIGKAIVVDLAKVPEKWTMDEWMYFLKKANLAVVDSFKEGTGVASGKLAGGMNNNTTGVIDAELGSSIQQYIGILQFIEEEMSRAVGITQQRLGQISNRETVGGIERATLQSSLITEWLFGIHDNVKKRVYECFLEVAKIALRGKNKKFSYILPDGSRTIIEINGDEFAEPDYGLLIDTSNGAQELNQKIDRLAELGLQNGSSSMGTLMKLYGSSSISEKIRMIEKDEKRLREAQEKQSQIEQQLRQQEMQFEAQREQARMELEDMLNQRDNETKILLSQLSNRAGEENLSPEVLAKLSESARQFDERLSLDKKRLSLEERKASEDVRLKEKILNKKSNS